MALLNCLAAADNVLAKGSFARNVSMLPQLEDAEADMLFVVAPLFVEGSLLVPNLDYGELNGLPKTSRFPAAASSSQEPRTRECWTTF